MKTMSRFVVCCIVAFLAVAGLAVSSVQTAEAAPVAVWVPWNDGFAGSKVTALVRAVDGTLYAGTSDEGVFASRDDGRSWAWSGQGLPQVAGWPLRQYPEVTILATDVSGARVWAGTSRGLFVLTGGQWGLVPVGSGTSSISAFGAPFQDSRILFVGTEGKVYRSQDGGSSWMAVGAPLQGIQANAFFADRYSSLAIFCCTAQGIFRSSDAGMSWLPMGGMPVNLVQLSQNSHDRSTLLAGGPAGVVRSYDGGISWTHVSPDGISVLRLIWDNYDTSQVRVLAREGVLRSDDGGETWSWEFQAAGSAPLLCGILTSTGTDVSILAGTGTGVALIRGSVIEVSVQGLGFLDSTAVGIDSRQSISYAVRRRSLYMARGDGPQWNTVDQTLGNVRVLSLSVDQTQPRVLYAVTAAGLFRSSDGGQGWTIINGPPGTYKTACADSAVPDVLYVGTSLGLYRSRYGYSSRWESVSPVSGSSVDAVTVSPTSAATVFAVVGNTVWKTMDACATWIQSGSTAGLGLQMLTAGGGSPSRLYAATLSGPRVSSDDGASWVAWGSGLGGQRVTYVAVGTGAVAGLAATEEGVFKLIQVEDNRPPLLTVVSPQDALVTTSPQIDVAGNVVDQESSVATCTVNGKPVTVGANGSFTMLVDLARGDNTIVVIATDVAGNSVQKQFKVTWRQTSTVLMLKLGSRTMTVSGRESILLDTEPTLFRSRTYLPIRAVVEALGGTVTWNATSRSVELHLAKQTVVLTIGQAVATVNGTRTQVDAQDALIVPMIIQGRTLLPVRFVAESLGCRVDWNQNDKTIVITYPIE
jgi:hypothetical protein